MAEKSAYTANIEAVIGHSLVGSILGISYELGILQALIDAPEPVTSQQVADAKNLKERYVRESLNCLACAQIVEVNRDGGGTVRYHVTQEQGAVLTGPSTQMIGMIAATSARFVDMMDRFRADGPYDYPMADALVTAAIDRIGLCKLGTEVETVLSNIPGIRERLESGINVIELGSGQGRLICTLAEKFPKSRFTGSEYTDSGVQFLQNKKTELKLDNIEMKKLDLLNVADDYVGKFDFAVINDVIHDLPDSLTGLKGCRKVLKTGSYFAFMEIDGTGDVVADKSNSHSAVLYSLSTLLCVAQAYHNADAHVYGACWGRSEAARLAKEAGFKVLSQHGHSGCFVLHACQAV